MSRLRVAVIQGGASAEAEVSRASARAIETALREAGHDATRLELDPYLPETLRTGAYDVAFPIAHGAVGEDGSLQGLFELLEIPYVGSNVLASALAMQKPMAKVHFERAGLPLARGKIASRETLSGKVDVRTVSQALLTELGTALVVKPVASGSAVGVNKLATATPDALASALEETWATGGDALVEAMLVGREVTCGVLDLHGAEPKALPPTEVLANNDAFYNFQARYAPGRSEHRCPADLGALTPKVQAAALSAHRSLGCRDFSRVDFVVADDHFIVLEVNTLPGFTATSLYPEAAGIMGLPIAQLCSELVESALRRGAQVRTPPRALPSA